jgi:hypothetical protein
MSCKVANWKIGVGFFGILRHSLAVSEGRKVVGWVKEEVGG